jgi:hypothetical protein
MTDNSEYNRGFEDGLAIGADRIEGLQAEVERLTFDGIHTCHADCPRLPCGAIITCPKRSFRVASVLS